MPYFEFIGEDKARKSEKAEKFWEISQDGKEVHIRFGKIGANGQSTIKSFDDDEAAAAEVAKLIREKMKKGYHEATPPSS